MPVVHIWAPPAGVNLITPKELAKAQRKQPELVTHVILIPCLLYQEE